MARTPNLAVSEFVERAQRALSCLTNAVLARDPATLAGLGTRLYLSRGLPARLSPSTSLVIRLTVVAATIRPSDWNAQVAGYKVSFLTHAGREFLAFHWHPDGASHVKTPHAHILIGSAEERALLGNGHIPTPELSVGQLVRFAIEDLGVPAIREDWRQILAD